MFTEPVNYLTGYGARDQSLSKDFADPFLFPSSREMPTDFRSVFDVCLYVWLSNPEYQQAQIKTTAHFLTEFEFPTKTGDRTEKEEFREFLDNDLKLFDALHVAGEEFGAYGNVFARLFLPFNRFLVDERAGPENRVEWSLQSFPEELIRYRWQTVDYEVPDPRQTDRPMAKRKKVALPFCDRRAADMKRLRLRLLDPRNVYIKHALWSGQNQYVAKLDPSYISQIKTGLLWQVNDTPIWVLEAIRDGHDIQFSDGEIFHLKCPTISGITNGGFGLPPVIANFRNLHQVAVYRKMDEAIGRDYILPLRVLSPNATTTLTDALNNSHLGEWKASAAEMIKRHRIDPFAIHATPFPLTMQQLGGDGSALVSKDLQKFQRDTTLDGAGFPAELFHSSLSYQMTPIALRNFEQAKRFLGRGLSDMVAWVADRVNDFMGRARIPTKLARPTVVDDLERRSIFLQLAASGEFPRSLAYRSFNAGDPVENARQRAAEDAEIAKAQEEVQMTFERERLMGSLSDQIANSLGQAPAGVQYTPIDRQQKIDQEATRLLNIGDNGARAKEMNMLRASDPDMYALVKQRMEEFRAQGASMGRAQAGQMAAEATQA